MKIAIWRLGKGLGGTEASLIELANFIKTELNKDVVLFGDLSSRPSMKLAAELNVPITDYTTINNTDFSEIEMILLYGCYVDKEVADLIQKVPIRILVVGGFLDLHFGIYPNYKFSNRLIVKSQGIKDWILGKHDVNAYLNEESQKNILTAQFPIDLNYWQPHDKPRSDDVIIGNVGRILPSKCVYKIIELYNEIGLSGTKLELYEYVSDQKEFSKDIYRTPCLQPGQTPSKELYNNFDIFISLTEKEGVPRHIMEAMAMGLPIVTTNVGGIPDLDPNFMFDPDSPDIKKKLVDLILNKDCRVVAGSSNRFRIKAYNEHVKNILFDYFEKGVYDGNMA